MKEMVSNSILKVFIECLLSLKELYQGWQDRRIGKHSPCNQEYLNLESHS